MSNDELRAAAEMVRDFEERYPLGKCNMDDGIALMHAASVLSRAYLDRTPEPVNERLLEACKKSLNWFSLYPGGGALKMYDEMRDVLSAAERAQAEAALPITEEWLREKKYQRDGSIWICGCGLFVRNFGGHWRVQVVGTDNLWEFSARWNSRPTARLALGVEGGSMKISDEFWRLVIHDKDWFIIVKPDLEQLVIGNDDPQTESDARLICDLHNAALVQEKRGWLLSRHVPNGRHGPTPDGKGKWVVPFALRDRLHEIVGDTAVAALLAANAWMEQNEASEVKP